jgi:multicomponent Na+:H+ antiporter subunit B
MSPRLRQGTFFVFALGIAALLAWAFLGIHDFGDYRGPYGTILTRVAVAERVATNVVSAINYDYRALDTLGEEFILFTAVTGVALLLRATRKQRPPIEPETREIDDSLRYAGRATVGASILFGLYIILHGPLTPGGGFQGGGIVATGLFLIFLTGGHPIFRKVVRREIVEGIEATGAGGYAVVGLIALLTGATFLQNILPLGKQGSILSSGTIALINFLVSLDVGGGFLLLYLEFLIEVTRRPRPEKGR